MKNRVKSLSSAITKKFKFCRESDELVINKISVKKEKDEDRDKQGEKVRE